MRMLHTQPLWTTFPFKFRFYFVNFVKLSAFKIFPFFFTLRKIKILHSNNDVTGKKLQLQTELLCYEINN